MTFFGWLAAVTVTLTGGRGSTLSVSEGITGCWWRGVTLPAFRLELTFQTCTVC